MIKIAIVDDEHNDRLECESILNEYVNNQSNMIVKINTFASGNELLKHMSIHGLFDIYFLDIIMNDIDGIHLGLKIREQDNHGQIIYVTSESQYALDAYNTYPLFYLTKPIDNKKFFSVLGKAFDLIKSNQNKAITVKTTDGLSRINIDDIIAVELIRRCLKFHLNNRSVIKSTTIRVNFAESLSEILEDERFSLCGASFVVNMHEIHSVQQESILFNNGFELSPPKNSIPRIRSKWLDYWLE